MPKSRKLCKILEPTMQASLTKATCSEFAVDKVLVQDFD